MPRVRSGSVAGLPRLIGRCVIMLDARTGRGRRGVTGFAGPAPHRRGAAPAAGPADRRARAAPRPATGRAGSGGHAARPGRGRAGRGQWRGMGRWWGLAAAARHPGRDPAGLATTPFLSNANARPAARQPRGDTGGRARQHRRLRSADTVTVRVLTLNSRGGSADPAALLAVLRQHAVDVLAVQELTWDLVHRLDEAGLGGLLPHTHLDPRPDSPGARAVGPLAADPAAVGARPGGRRAAGPGGTGPRTAGRADLGPSADPDARPRLHLATRPGPAAAAGREQRGRRW